MKSFLKHAALTILILIALYRLTSYSQTISEHAGLQENKGGQEKHSAFALYKSETASFTGVTVIKFDIYKLTQVKLGVYQPDGSLVEILVDSEMQPGEYNIFFKAPDWLEKGQYTYRLEAEGESESMNLNYAGK